MTMRRAGLANEELFTNLSVPFAAGTVGLSIASDLASANQPVVAAAAQADEASSAGPSDGTNDAATAPAAAIADIGSTIAAFTHEVILERGASWRALDLGSVAKEGSETVATSGGGETFGNESANIMPVVAALNGDALEHIPTASSGVATTPGPSLPYDLLPSNDALTGTGAANAR
jgi:hypothetical protein